MENTTQVSQAGGRKTITEPSSLPPRSRLAEAAGKRPNWALKPRLNPYALASLFYELYFTTGIKANTQYSADSVSIFYQKEQSLYLNETTI